VKSGLKTVQRIGTILAGLAGLLLFVATATVGHGPAPTRAKEPEITYQFPKEGDVLKAPPFVLQMCFKDPVNVNDLDKGGDFRFRLVRPDNKGLGMRIVFQPDGYGVAIYPGLPKDEQIPDGNWSWEYRLTEKIPATQPTGTSPKLDATEGTVKFSVNAQTGKDTITATPPACLAAGATQVPTAPPAGSPGVTNSPGPTGGATEEDGGGPDILRLALLTIGAAGAAGLLALIGYVIRKRIGYEPHAPKSGEEPPEHH